MARMKWKRNSKNNDQHSECGRFIIRAFCVNPKWWGYWGLTVVQTGQEFPCRTEKSAKVAAKNISATMATSPLEQTL